MESLWRSVLLSLEIAGAATAATALCVTPLAYWMARRRFVGRGLVETVVLLPMVLPPTVVGYLILELLGSRGWVGGWLKQAWGYSIIFRFEGAVLAAFVVAVPMLYLPAKAAFQTVDRELEDISRTLGANRLQLFWHVSLPMARRGLCAGLILAFARALGEFGATLMVFGWQPGRVTLPISIYASYEQGELAAAWPAVVVLMVVSGGMVLGYNWLLGGRGRGYNWLVGRRGE